MFATADTWPLRDNANPSSGWDLADVEATANGPATGDLYGKLHVYVCGIVRSFLESLDRLEAAQFRLLHGDALQLPESLGRSDSFDRIEVSFLAICRSLRVLLY